MTKEELIRNLKYTMEKHKNDKVDTFGTNISLMCKDVLDYLEQPTTKDCLVVEDCVSRQEVIKYLNTNMEWYDENGNIADSDEKLNALTDLINGVPPVTPTHKVGKWIRKPIRNEKGGCIGAEMICSYCKKDNEQDKKLAYCPNCGAEMRGSENG